MKIKAEVPPGYKKIESGALRNADLVYDKYMNEWRCPNKSDLTIVGRNIKDYYGVCRKIEVLE